jgi:hypothetical protein
MEVQKREKTKREASLYSCIEQRNNCFETFAHVVFRTYIDDNRFNVTIQIC